jgi:choline-sulfatase
MPSRQPNILLVMTDQHRADLMGCAGRDLVPTPNIDRIARQGVRFENAYCAYPVCVASRMAMLTGLHAHQTGAIDNDDHLDWRYRTMAHHFADQGYLTGLIGKMHFADAHNHGFEYYLSINDWLMYLGPQVQHYANEIASNPGAKDLFLRTMYDTGAGFPDVYDLWDGKGSPWAGKVQQYDFRSMASDIPADDHLDMFVARESAKFLRQYRDQPFFLCASFMKPHTPLFPPREWAEQYPVEDMELVEPPDISGYPEHLQNRIRHTTGRDPLLRKASQAGYLGNLAFADHCIGVLLDAFEELGLAENTIVVYTSDHGDMLQQNGLIGKFCLFDPSVKVPLIVSYPKELPQTVVSTALIEQLGLYPTLVELTGTGPVPAPAYRPIEDAPETIAGRSFADCIRDPNCPGDAEIFSEYNLRSNNCQYMLRTDRYKYVHNDGSTDELYDLREDPGETRNRIADASLQPLASDLRARLFARFHPASNRYRTQPLG